MSNVWQMHQGSDCPIPNAKAGEYEVRWKFFGETAPTVDAPDVAWGKVEGYRDKVIAYRLIDKNLII